MLRIEQSKTRQSRLLEILADRKLDAIAVGLRHHAYYFSAHLPFWQHEGAFVLFADRAVAAHRRELRTRFGGGRHGSSLRGTLPLHPPSRTTGDRGRDPSGRSRKGKRQTDRCRFLGDIRATSVAGRPRLRLGRRRTLANASPERSRRTGAMEKAIDCTESDARPCAGDCPTRRVRTRSLRRTPRRRRESGGRTSQRLARQRLPMRNHGGPPARKPPRPRRGVIRPRPGTRVPGDISPTTAARTA